jgi:hypothetical protein
MGRPAGFQRIHRQFAPVSSERSAATRVVDAALVLNRPEIEESSPRTLPPTGDRAAARPLQCQRDHLPQRLAAALRRHPSSDCGEAQIAETNQRTKQSTRNLDLAGCHQYGPRGFKGDGAQSPSHGIVSGLQIWRKARKVGEVEVAINRLTKLRFPQGSEVWISGCPKFVAAAKSGLTNSEVEAKTVQPEPLRWRAVFAFPLS